jgi:predicted GTPase
VLQPQNLQKYLQTCGVKPKIVVTDSQAFEAVAAVVPADIAMTGFSVLLARAKGAFDSYLKGTPQIDNLQENDRILILESCSHHSTCDDIGRVKLPRLLQKHTGKTLQWDVVAGLDNIERDITDYAMVIQCGACMITHRQLINRLRPAIEAGVPISNYGMTLAWCNGIYNRATSLFIK